MASTTPNKEIVRRICHLHGATECYLFVETDDEAVEVLTNITDEAMEDCLSELESWAGMKFRVSNFSKNKKEIGLIQSKSEQILPIKL
ncbi:MAG: hypothetical protein L3J51_04320 [Cocleimonas sp.]|nr:hypothetical protein [Cocleimonas sp.]